MDREAHRQTQDRGWARARAIRAAAPRRPSTSPVPRTHTHNLSREHSRFEAHAATSIPGIHTTRISEGKYHRNGPHAESEMVRSTPPIPTFHIACAQNAKTTHVIRVESRAATSIPGFNTTRISLHAANPRPTQPSTSHVFRTEALPRSGWSPA